MSEHRISRIYRKNEENFLRELENAAVLQERQVHLLRLQIRNMFLLLHLLQSLSKGQFRARRLIKLLRPLYDRAGKFRTASLNIKLTQPYRSAELIGFKEQMKANMEKQRLNLQDELSGFRLKKFRRLYALSLEAFESLKPKKIQKKSSEHLRVLLAEVRVDIFDISDDETLHQIRNKVREIKIVGSFLDECGIRHPFEKELRRLKVTYEKISSWYDTDILIDDLEDFVDELEDEKALEKTMPLVLVLKKKNLHTKKQIEKKLKVDLVM